VILVVILIFIVTPSGRARTRLLLIASLEERNRIVPDEYHDVHAGAAFAALLTIAAGALLISLANSLGQRTSSTASLPFVGSVRSQLAAMHDTAMGWHEDAYLTGAMYDFSDEPVFILWAEYRAPSHPRQNLTIILFPTGEYKKITSDLDSSVLPAPIQVDDRLIDSSKVISLFSVDAGTQQCLAFADRRRILELTRSGETKTGEMVWCLWIEGCKHVCRNATTR
jgi:hypothetical protein